MKKSKETAVRFVKNLDGTVTDNLLKVVWGPTLSERMTWSDAGKACKKLALNGRKGWRLPTVNELFSLVDRSRKNPATNAEIFGDTKTDDWYWTSEKLAGSTGCAWVVVFSDGGVGGCNKDYTYFVRLVRSSQ
jgi:hypothetical protein